MNITRLTRYWIGLSLFLTQACFAEKTITPEVWGLLSKIPVGFAEAAVAESSYVTKSALRFSYNAAEFTAITPMFGLGHIIQNRYLKRGWFFTTVESAALAMYITSNNAGCPGEVGGGCSVGALALLAAGVLESVDLFMGVREERKRKRKISPWSASIQPEAQKKLLLKLSYSF